MVTTKQEKRKRKKTKSRRPRPPPPVGLAGRALARADPTSLLLERQQVGNLIKNHRTAGGEIYQPAYNAYYDTVTTRSVASRMNRPDVYQLEGVRARRYLRDVLVPRGHGGQREISVRVDTGTGPDPDGRPRGVRVSDSAVDQFQDSLLGQTGRTFVDAGVGPDGIPITGPASVFDPNVSAVVVAEPRSIDITAPDTTISNISPIRGDTSSTVDNTPGFEATPAQTPSQRITSRTSQPFTPVDLSAITESSNEYSVAGDDDAFSEEEKDSEPDDGSYEDDGMYLYSDDDDDTPIQLDTFPQEDISTSYEFEPGREENENVNDDTSWYAPSARSVFDDVTTNMRSLLNLTANPADHPSLFESLTE